jgi:HEAT repeat protein
MERDVVVDGGNLVAYLGRLLETPAAEGDTDQSDSLLRAAATVVAAVGIVELQPVLLARLARDGTAQWVEELLGRFPERITPRLAQLLEHPDAEVRCGALRVGAFDTADLSVVVSHLADQHLPVRAAACLALGRIGLDAAAPLLLERLRNGEPEERAAAGQSLSRLSPEVLGELDDCLEPGVAEPVVVEALGVLARTPVPALEPRILALAESQSPGIRLAALRAASRLAGSKAEIALMRALADRHLPIQAEALDLLVRRGGEKSVTTLIAMLGTADSIRFHVIRALGQCQAQAAAVRLRELLPQCGPHEQLQIVSSLLRIAPP